MFLQFLFGYLLGINLFALLTYGYDKLRAKKEQWRVPESTLLWLAVVGGSIGAILGMRLFHHKTQHWKFKFGLPLILILQILCVVLYFWFLNQELRESI